MAQKQVEMVVKNYAKEKTVRFADMEGHSLCEVFQIQCLNNCNGVVERRSICRTVKNSQVKAKPLSIYNLPWNQDQLYDRVEQLNVSLENIVKTQKGVIGMVAVKNIAYCKDVSIVFTFDSWVTHLETKAAFYKQDESRNIDFFVFVTSNKASCFDQNWKLEFAICYNVAGLQYWDNNNGDNYKVCAD